MVEQNYEHFERAQKNLYFYRAIQKNQNIKYCSYDHIGAQ